MKIGSLGEASSEEEIEIVGRIKNIRKHKRLYFLTLQDHSGEIQCVLENFENNLPKKESVIKISGSLKINQDVRSGIPGREVFISSINPISPCYDVPEYDYSTDFPSRKAVIQNRHLFLRNPKIRDPFTIKSDILRSIRDFFYNEGFIEIQSPTIVEEGIEGPVNAFKMDYFGREAYLSLSNMLYHQMLISGDIEKIFEIGKLFRQEKSNSSIHLNEFMILDYTQANASREEIMDLTERLIKHSVDSLKTRGHPIAVEIPGKFPVVKYSELLHYLNQQGQNIGWAEMHTIGRGAARTIKSLYPSFFWLIDQPAECKSFFTKIREENGRYVSSDCQLWYADNSDLADGAERVTDYQVALKRIESKGLNPDSFRYYLNSLKHGSFPCTGIGVGLERMIMTLSGQKNIRDVVLFPRDPKTTTP